MTMRSCTLGLVITFLKIIAQSDAVPQPHLTPCTESKNSGNNSGESLNIIYSVGHYQTQLFLITPQKKIRSRGVA